MRPQIKNVAALVLMMVIGITGMMIGSQFVQAEETGQTVIDINSEWEYLDDNTNDSNEMGMPSYTFQTTFEIENSEDIESIYYQLRFKNDVNIYLNGVKIGNYNVSEDEGSAKGENEEEDSKNVGEDVSGNIEEDVSGNIEEDVSGNIEEDDSGNIDQDDSENIDKDDSENIEVEVETNTLLDSYREEEYTVTDDTTDMMVQDILIEGTNVLSIELHQSSSSDTDINFDFVELTLNSRAVEEEYTDIKALTVGPGSDQSELRFTWHADTPVAGNLKLYQGDKEIGTFSAAREAIQNGMYANRVTVSGLKGNTTYRYCVGNGGKWSQEYEITTGNPTSYSFFVVGDPQIGYGNIESDTQKWSDTINSALQAFPGVSFMISAGDVVQTATNEEMYDGYLSPLGLKSLPVAQTAGNHDLAVNFIDHFNFPNYDNTLVNTNAGGDYWFVYGNALFMSLNSNHKNIKQHKQFMEQAIAQNPNAKFRIVFYHHAIYSVGSHSLKASIITRRETWAPVFDELGIDFVFSGHDHSYVRTYQMYNDAIVDNVKIKNGLATDPAGTVYITANSSSGSKFYGILQQEFYFAANYSQLKTATISKVDMTENQLTFKTYRVDTMEVVDEYSIVKTQVDTVNKPKKLQLTNSGKTSIKLSWNQASGVKGYQVWYSTTKDGTYKKAGTVTTTSFTHKNLTIGRKYYYKVRAYKKVKGKTAYSEFTSIKSLKVPVPQPTNVKTKNVGAASIKISWKKVSGASGYRIYRATKKKGTYQKIATVSSSKKSYTDKTVKNKKTYYYKIRAINKIDGTNKFSAYTNPVKKKAVLSKPTGIKAKKVSSGNTIKISWTKVTGAKQYRIYRKTSKKGKYVRIATVNANKTSYKNKNLKKNKTYYYKVRAVQKVSKKNYLSAYSAEVSAKVK